MKFKPLALVLAAALFLWGTWGCSAANNYLQPADFASYLEANGVKVTSVRVIPGTPFRADGGAAIMVDGSEIGVYKFDQSAEAQKKRLKMKAESGRTYINGVPYPVEVFGSFMFMGLEKNKKKRAILKVIPKFK